MGFFALVFILFFEWAKPLPEIILTRDAKIEIQDLHSFVFQEILPLFATSTNSGVRNDSLKLAI